MKKVFHIKDNIYHISYLIYVGSYKEKEAYLYKKYKAPKEEQKFNGGENELIAWPDGSFVNVIWLPRFDWTIDQQCALSHELIHAIFKTLHRIGIKFDVDNHESFTYYYEYLYGKILKEFLVFRKD